MIHILIPTTKNRREKLDECLTAIRENTDIPHLLTVYENSEGGCVPANLRMVEGLKDNEIVVVLNDDMIVQPNWLGVLISAYLQRFPDGNGLAYPDDMLRGELLSTIFCCTVKYLKENYFSGYRHNYADQELMDRSQGKLLYVPESKVLHKHMNNGGTPDETYALQSKSFNDDERLYYQRKDKQYENI
jgi:hypothetical protein